MEDREYNVVTLENNIEYTEVAKLEHNGNTYVFLSNLDDSSDFCIRKLVNENDKDYIIGLDNKEEFDTVLNLFAKDYIN